MVVHQRPRCACSSALWPPGCCTSRAASTLALLSTSSSAPRRAARADCANIDITSATGYTSVAACRQWCMAYGSACCGAVWNKLDMTTCWLKACGCGYSFTANANRWCNFLRSRLSAAVLATLPTMSRSLSPSASASPLPAPVWALAVDAETGLGAFSSVVGGGAMVWDTDRRGCRCGALRLPGGSYLTLAANAQAAAAIGTVVRIVQHPLHINGKGHAAARGKQPLP